MEFSEVIVKQGVMYGYPCVLFRHNEGFAWSYRQDTKDLGKISKEAAIQRFDNNFALDV
jgi:hypothetical protein